MSCTAFLQKVFLLGLVIAGLAGLSPCVAEENASNPLASVNNTDGRLRYFDLGDADRLDAWIDGAYMAIPKLKLKYELRYWKTNVTGTRQSDWDSFHFKPI